MKILTVLIATTLYSTAAAAESPAALPDSKAIRLAEAKFQSLDRNHDQRISKTEAAADQTVANRFAGVDSNADGFISRSEFEARPSAKPFE
jgi:Ca2+-binding EF-hand superfamily protein